MNKKILFAILLLAIVTLPISVSGQTLKEVVNNVKDQLIPLAAGLSTIAFIVSGLMFLSATGNPSRMTIARGSLMAGVIGIVIIILANNACTFVHGIFGVGSCGS